MARELVVFGASGHGGVVAAAAMAAGWTVTAFCDDDPTRQGGVKLGLPVRPIDGLHAGHIALGVGGCRAREALSMRLLTTGWDLVTLVHPSAVVERYAELGTGTFVAAGAVVCVGADLGAGVIVNTGATVDHDCRVGAFAHIAPGAHLAGDVVVGKRAWVGIGACSRQGITIGPDALVGAGAVLVHDVPAGAMVYGNPARVQGGHA